MRSYTRKQGFLTFAQNGKDDYLRLAYGLALSLRATQNKIPHLSVVITPGTKVPDKYREVFDEIIDVPWIDEAKNSDWKLENEWKAFHITPYEQTFKLDADMLFTKDIWEWWQNLINLDTVACTSVESYRGDIVTSDFYRKCFTANNLPNVYTGMMYFRVCDFTKELFDLAEEIYHNWQLFFKEYLEPVTRPTFVSTDVVFALAMKILDPLLYTFPSLTIPRFVHMKSRLQGWPSFIENDDNWMKHVPVTFTNDLVLKIGRYHQVIPVHYHEKSFLTDEMILAYEKRLGL